MRFGGHETFAVREGWISRGLSLVFQDPEAFTNEHLEDDLGVGRNMAKSIRHWLQAVGLVEPLPKGSAPTPTEFGRLVYDNDPHFLHPETWWFLHMNLVRNPAQAFTWNWFFNHWSTHRFDRGPCLESLRRYSEVAISRSPSVKTLQRDLNTMLQTYATPVPPQVDDPEDTSSSPFQDLQLLKSFTGSGYMRLNYELKPIPAGVFGYAIAGSPAFVDLEDISLVQLERGESGPGKCFVLRGDELLELCGSYESECSELFALRTQAGERTLRLQKQMSLNEWAAWQYKTLEVPSYA